MQTIYSTGSVSTLLMAMESMAHCSCSSVEIQLSTFFHRELSQGAFSLSHLHRSEFRDMRSNNLKKKKSSAFQWLGSIKEMVICFRFDKGDLEKVNYCAHSPRPLTFIIRTTCVSSFFPFRLSPSLHRGRFLFCCVSIRLPALQISTAKLLFSFSV